MLSKPLAAIAVRPYRDPEGIRRPLVEQLSDREGDEKSGYSLDEDDGYELELLDVEQNSSCSSRAKATMAVRRFSKIALVLLLLVPLAYWTWKWYMRPWLQDEWDFREGFLVKENSTYEIAKGGHFDGVRVQEFDTRLLPGGEEDPDGNRRLIFVGDIHGCARELKKLLKKLEFDEEKDHLIAVGDLISKGPDNVGVLDELIRVNASSVRGNHDDRVLSLVPSILEDSAETSSKGSEKDKVILHQLSRHHLKYLQSIPLILRIPPLPLASTSSRKTHSPIAEEILVVHAGLVPAIPLKAQDPYFVMNMRSIYTKSHLPLAEAEAKNGKSRPWHDIWGWYNDRLFRKKSLKDFEIWDSLEDEDTDSWLGTLGLIDIKKWPKPQVVVYGHHAKAGLQLARWSKGLDTACVKGNELTAMVLDANGNYKIVSVNCGG